MKDNEPRSWKTPEFLLVIVMLLVLTVLVMVVLWAPIPGTASDAAYMRAVLDYRQSILSVIVAAFGAWVGAGAAYYFGRENMREASSSLLAMREPSPRERLRRTPVREIPPRPIDWVVNEGDEVSGIVEKIKASSKRWFIPVVKDDGALNTVVHEEALWRFVDSESEKGTPYADILKKRVADLMAYLGADPALDRLQGIHVVVTMDQSSGDINEEMQNEEVYLAIVTDEKGRPTHFATTGDIRKVLLQIG
jgi:hypothetical protein